MNKELQDKAWSVLPKEFKEEVKKYFAHYRCAINTYEAIINHIFGRPNLTSDAEGEEMLHIRRSEVTSRYEAYSKESANVKNNEPYLQFCEGRLNVLTNLFGSKCLPDDTKDDTKEPKPAEPKFKVGDKVKIAKNGNVYNNSIGEIIDISSNGSAYILFCNGQAWFRLTDLEPYTEPEEKSRNLSQEIAYCDKWLDNILKDSFRNERRLNIAAMAMQGILSNEVSQDVANMDSESHQYPESIAKYAVACADALIAELNKTKKEL